ncbi:MAG: thiamine phosphate synthase [Paracoccaceae bacterium]|nr:thiamine phosphate synthase [Paracoccaceae bacterium]
MSQENQPQLYLITPPEFELENFSKQLQDVFAVMDVSCLRLALSSQDADYVSRTADALREICHAAEVAIVIEDHVNLVEALGLDGVHLSDGARSVGKVRRELGTDAIIGAYCAASRHDGISAAEASADYVAFGPITETPLGTGDVAEMDLFDWWSAMIEVPVVAEGGLSAELVKGLSTKTDFYGVGMEIWDQADPAASLKALLG